MSPVRSILARTLGVGGVLWAMASASPAEAREAYQRVVPPENVIPQLQKVVLVETGGAASQAFQGAIVAGLRTRLGYNEGLPVADPGLRSDVIDATSLPGPVTPGMDEIIGLARDASAQAVIVANAEGHETAYETYTEDRKSTVVENGQSHEERWTVRCARRDVEVSWSATIFDGRDGAAVVSRSDTVSLSDKDCDEKGSDPLKVATVDDVVQLVVARGATTFITQWAPRWEKVKFPMPHALVAPARVRGEVERLSDEGGWADAVTAAEGILVEDPYNAVATYYIGLALEVHGRAEDASVLYSFANRLNEDRTFEQAASAARDRARELQVLSNYSVGKLYSWDQAGVSTLLERARKASAVAPAGQAAEIKGTGNKRTPVFESSSSSAAILVSIPGGTRVRSITSEGGMVQVQLPDGQLGWVSEKLIH